MTISEYSFFSHTCLKFNHYCRTFVIAFVADIDFSFKTPRLDYIETTPTRRRYARSSDITVDFLSKNNIIHILKKIVRLSNINIHYLLFFSHTHFRGHCETIILN